LFKLKAKWPDVIVVLWLIYEGVNFYEIWLCLEMLNLLPRWL